MGIDVNLHSKDATNRTFAKRKERHHIQEKQLKDQQAALAKQKSGLETFRTALKDLGKVEEGLLKNNTSSSIKDVATVSANEKALKGSYSFFVERLASAHQLAFTGLTDDLVKNEQSPLELSVNGKPLNIELKGVDTVADLAHAINNAKDNPGVTASVVRSNGQHILLLTSDKSGKDNKIEFTGQRPVIFASSNEKELSPAQDSLVYIGDKSNDLKVESSSNTLDKVIDGVTIELIKVQKPGDPLLEVKVDVNPTETEGQIKKFVDAFNSVKSAVSSKERGDSLPAALKQSLNSLVSQSYGGKTLGMIGVSFDRNGDLKLDSKKLTEVLKNSPTMVTELLSGTDGLISKLDKALDPYLSTSTGSLKKRSEMLEIRQTSLAWAKDSLEKSYEIALKNNMRKYNNLSNQMDKMQSIMNMFSQEAEL
ncbi:flagellar filament capping protein FliD [Yersinia intermedia]|uniref:flagellar filament capping protein FliD n=1 Tax=Yersinia intermedia TaxID=631 RepID=UPI0005E1867C|nr:flagellar filament capping protein FliD [Yersinia intermedia]CNC12601.1 putative flagellar hook-associated protein [Yersinia intermedia]CRE92119.1 putative flagellar hook-associated protein [Yersinia intermedia]